jgi:hypothetical protein
MRFVLAVRTQKTSIFYLKNELIFLNSVKWWMRREMQSLHSLCYVLK